MTTDPTPAAPSEGWSTADTEEVVCCLCGVPGQRRHTVGVFGVVQCPTCDLVFTSPRLRPDALQRLYDDAGYFEGRIDGSGGRFSLATLLPRIWTAGRLRLIDQVRGRRPGGRLLEVGAAYGLFLDAARSAGWTTEGVELSRTAAEHARRDLGLDVFNGPLTEAPITPGLDVVCAWDTLEHVPDPLAFLRAVRALVADDGVVVLSTPSAASLPARALGSRWWTLKPAEHIWHFTPRSHAVLAARAGLAVTQVVRSPVSPSNAGRTDSLVVVARPIPATGPAGS